MPVLSQKTINKTRKECQCFGCGRALPPGSKVHRSTYKDGRNLETQNWCHVCAVAWSRWDMDEIMPGEMRDHEEWEAVRLEIEGVLAAE